MHYRSVTLNALRILWRRRRVIISNDSPAERLEVDLIRFIRDVIIPADHARDGMTRGILCEKMSSSNYPFICIRMHTAQTPSAMRVIIKRSLSIAINPEEMSLGYIESVEFISEYTLIDQEFKTYTPTQ